MNENEDLRSLAVGLIWIGAGLAIGMTNVNSGDINVFNMLISVFIAFGALGSTIALMRGADFFKAKRDSAASDDYSNLLIQLMSEEERKALRSRLINNVANDGEIISHEDEKAEKQRTT